MEGPQPSHRRRAFARYRLAGGAASSRLYLWPDTVRRNSGNRPAAAGIRAGTHQNGAFRSDRRILMDNTTLDGNAAGGILREIFPFEMTLAEGTCAHCGSTRVVGELTVYKSAMGTVMRCPTCDNVLMRIVSARGRYWLDMQGVRVLHIRTEL